MGPETPVNQFWLTVYKMSGVLKTKKERSIPVLPKGELEAVTNDIKGDIFVDVFQAVHSSGNLGVERYEEEPNDDC